MYHLPPLTSRCLAIFVLPLLAYTAAADERAAEFQKLDAEYKAEALYPLPDVSQPRVR